MDDSFLQWDRRGGRNIVGEPGSRGGTRDPPARGRATGLQGDRAGQGAAEDDGQAVREQDAGDERGLPHAARLHIDERR